VSTDARPLDCHEGASEAATTHAKGAALVAHCALIRGEQAIEREGVVGAHGELRHCGGLLASGVPGGVGFVG